MKTILYICVSVLAFSLLLSSEPAMCQPENYNCTCVYCHVPCNAPLSAHTNPQCPIVQGRNQNSGQSSSTTYTEPAALPVGSVEAAAYYTKIMLEHARDINNRGVEAYNKGKYAAAASAFRKALKYDKNNGTYRQNLANAKEMLNREKSAKIKSKTKNNSHEAKKYIDELKTFSNSINENVKTYEAVQKKLKKQLGSYVPPLKSRREIKEGVILGMSNTQYKNAIVEKGLKSPFSDEKIPFYATSDNDKWTDLGRVALDNMTTGKCTSLKTEVGQELVKELDNTYFDLLMAHSNGATVTEALLRADVIHAKELHIMGGDRSLTNFGGYADLIATGKVEKVVVWLNPADFVPYGSSIFDLVMNGSHDKNLQVENYNAYFQHIMDEMNATKNIEYRWLSGPEFSPTGQKFQPGFDAHGLDVYWDNIRRYRALSAEKQKQHSFNMWDWF